MLQGIVGMDSPYNRVDFWAVSCKYVKPKQAELSDSALLSLWYLFVPSISVSSSPIGVVRGVAWYVLNKGHCEYRRDVCLHAEPVAAGCVNLLKKISST